MSGSEKLTVAAGTFDAIRLDGYINVETAGFSRGGTVTIWYSKDDRRLLKQVASMTVSRSSASSQLGGIQYKETLELSAMRRVAR